MSQEDENPDKIFVAGKLTDFEKLLVANSVIEQQKKVIQALETELGTYKFCVDENDYLKKRVQNLEEKCTLMSKDELKIQLDKLKKQHFVDLKNAIKPFKEEIARLHKTVSRLVTENVQLKPNK